MTNRSADAAGQRAKSSGAPTPPRDRKRWQRNFAWIAAAAVAVSTVTVLALQTQGYRGAEVELGDSAVWVTNADASMVGRVNGQINELNSAVTVSPDFDIIQAGGNVLVLDRTQDVLRPIDTGSVSLQPQIALPERALVMTGGSVVAIADQDSGRIWAGELSTLAGLDPTVGGSQLTTGIDPVLAVSPAGTVFAAVPGSDKLWMLEPGNPSAPPSILPGGPLSAGGSKSTNNFNVGSPISITTVGQMPVLLDRASGQLITPTARFSLPDAATAILQSPGPAADEVLVSTADRLLAISLTTGAARELAAGPFGGPAAPARIGDCALGAFSDAAATFVRACGQDLAQVFPVPDTNTTSRPELRILDGLAVLNDHDTGKVWSLDGPPVRIDNWADVAPLTITDENTESDDGDRTSDQLTSVRADCVTDVIEPPRPADKSFGVRAGRTTVLPVLDDAASSDCSMLAIVDVAGAAEPAQQSADRPHLNIVNNGQSLQISVPPDFVGQLDPMTYSVSDGINPAVSAAIKIDVVAPQTQSAPQRVRDSVVEVEVGGTAVYNVLQDYASPTGDDLFLTAATIGTEDEVTFKPDGTITFSDKGTGGAITKYVEIVISDGINTVAARLAVNVRAVGSSQPLASPVYARTVVGEPVTLWPLRSVISPSAERVRLSRVWAKSADPATSSVASQADGSVVVSSTNAGINYFLYEVSVAGKSTTGVLRVDVVDRPTAGAAPVPMTDIVYLQSGGTVTLDPTANDTDPMAGALAIAQTEVAALGSLNLTVTDMHLIRVSAPRPLPPGGGNFTYTVSNGYASAVGQVRVIPVPVQTEPAPPVATDAAITVRAGDAATLQIASLAQDPNGDLLTFTGIGATTLAPGQGVLFSTGSSLRYLAPNTVPAGAVQFAYTVVNSAGRKASALVDISVTSADSEVNAPPRIPALTVARVFAGSTVSVQLPLDGIDPDGDWTTVSAISQPSISPLGEAKPDGAQSISYRAFAVPGSDTFGYSAIDSGGQAVIGLVKVVVVARPTTINPPLAPDLVLDIRPGRTVGVDVLSDIQDGSGASVELADPAFAASGNLLVTVEDSLLVVTAPATEGVENIKYNVERSGLSASGVITVRISPTALVKPPTAEDVFVTDAMLSADGATATVDVRELITNPGGRVRDLVLDMDPAAAGQTMVSGARELTVALTDRRQVLSYRVTNRADQLSAQAFIVVPSRAAALAEVGRVAALPPQLKVGVPPLQVNAGESKTVLLADYVAVAASLEAQLPAGSLLASSQGQVTRIDNASFRFVAGVDDGGDAVITMVVTDGVNPSATLGIPVVIVPKVPALPLLSATNLEVEVGRSATVDLMALTVPGNAKQAKSLVYSANSAATGFSASVLGSELTVSVATDVPRGTVGTVTISVTDDLGRVVNAAVTVAATGSTEPLATLNPLTIPGRSGVEVGADVLVGAFNPFAGPLTLKPNVVVESGAGVVRTSGSQVLVTPAAGQSGSVVVRFTVADSTGDPMRDVTGRLTVAVADRPERPGTPTVLSVASSQVQLTWTENSDRGSPVLSYRVDFAGGSRTCAQSPCVIDALTNNTAYSFTVTAINAIGESDPSASSATVRPDTSPNKPAAPAAGFVGTGALQVSWSEPGSAGSPVTSYDLEISPADGQGRTSMTGLPGTSITWDGLANGVGYQFRVRAHNGAAQPGPFSEFSNAETPAAPPSAPAAPTVTAAADASSISVSWVPPQTNGSPITSYQVRVNDGVGIDVGAATGYRLADPQPGKSYSFTIRATNRAGVGPASAAASVTPYLTPGTVVLTATATEPDGKVTLSWTAPDETGATLSPYRLTIDAVAQDVSGNTFSYSGTAAVPVTFSVQACYVVLSTCGAASNEVTVTPYGPVQLPAGPTISALTTTSITFSWTLPPDNGRGPMRTQYSTDDGATWSADDATSYSFNGICGSGPYKILVRGLDSADAVGNPAAAQGKIADCDPQPQPQIALSKTGNANGQPGCAVPECQYVEITGTGFQPNAAVTCTPSSVPPSPSPPVSFAPESFTSNNAGNGSITTAWYYAATGSEISVTCTDQTDTVTQSLTW